MYTVNIIEINVSFINKRRIMVIYYTPNSTDAYEILWRVLVRVSNHRSYE